jgi:TrmH family RNA methyltransferase
MRSPGERRESGLAVCEGPRLLQDALACGARPLLVLRAEGTALPPLPQCARVVTVLPALLDSLCDTRSPKGPLFTVRLTAKEGKPAPGEMCVLLDSVQDPGNVGAVLRSADAFGFSVILTPGCADFTAPKALRAAMGAALRATVYRMAREDAAALDMPLYAACAGGGSVLRDMPGGGVIMIGSEGAGLCEALRKAARGVLTIPMRAGAQSLNAAAAAAILMWEMSK